MAESPNGRFGEPLRESVKARSNAKGAAKLQWLYIGKQKENSLQKEKGISASG